jgi:hypothetical protein
MIGFGLESAHLGLIAEPDGTQGYGLRWRRRRTTTSVNIDIAHSDAEQAIPLECSQPET